MFSPAYYAAGAIGGAAACGFTHAAVTPLDVIKCNIQVRNCVRLH
jgi:solute carrier family 25 phosphate transporter 3